MVNAPDGKVAVKPVTPIEFMVCQLCVPPLPPMYEIELLTPLAGIPAYSMPLLVAPTQLRVVMLPKGIITVPQVSFQLVPI